MSAPTNSDLRWQAAAEELAPQKSLARVSANAKSIVGTITIVATILAGFGTFAASQLGDNPGLLVGAALSIIAAASAAALSLSAIISRGTKIAPGNLDQVKSWYAKELEKGKRAAAGGVALIVAIAIATITSVSGLMGNALDRDPRAQMTIAVARENNASFVHLSSDVRHIPPGARIYMQLIDKRSRDWFHAVLDPAKSGKAALDQDVRLNGCSESLRFDLKIIKGGKIIKEFSLPSRI